MMTRDELEAWLRHPVTQWFLDQLEDPARDPDKTWFQAANWDETNIKRGERLKLMEIGNIIDPKNYD